MKYSTKHIESHNFANNILQSNISTVYVLFVSETLVFNTLLKQYKKM